MQSALYVIAQPSARHVSESVKKRLKLGHFYLVNLVRKKKKIFTWLKTSVSVMHHNSNAVFISVAPIPLILAGWVSFRKYMEFPRAGASNKGGARKQAIF